MTATAVFSAARDCVRVSAAVLETCVVLSGTWSARFSGPFAIVNDDDDVVQYFSCLSLKIHLSWLLLQVLLTHLRCNTPLSHFRLGWAATRSSFYL